MVGFIDSVPSCGASAFASLSHFHWGDALAAARARLTNNATERCKTDYSTHTSTNINKREHFCKYMW